MKLYRLLVLALAAPGVFAQGVQRIREPVPASAAVAPKFGERSPDQVSPTAVPTVNNAMVGRPGGPMPTPMGDLPRFAPKADLESAAIDQIVPLDEGAVLRVRKAVDSRVAAGNQSLTPPPRPVMRVSSVDTGPNAVPEVIRITQTEGATINFMDAAGRPWEVEDAINFSRSGLDIGRSGKYGVVLSAKLPETSGNISVLLAGFVGSIPFKVVVGPNAAREVDYVVDMQVPKFLPGAPAPVSGVVSQMSLGADELMNYLTKTPPRDAKELVVEGLPGAMAWQTVDGRMIFRTNHLAISPSAAKRQSSFDGTKVFELPVTPYVLVAADGQLINAKVSGYTVSKEFSK